ncbi:hypothetical protein MMC07_009555 [Pseudocyphellaria aurata]|nr:hypothetical protein [Pseudocyphellaria aurata]
MRIWAPNIPVALQRMVKRLSNLEDAPAEEFESPSSKKRIPYIDPISDETVKRRRSAQRTEERFGVLDKVKVHRRVQKHFLIAYAWANKRNPQLTKSMFEQMLNRIDPAFRNPWISARNHIAHKFSIEVARASLSRQGERAEILKQWVDLIAVREQDTSGTLPDEIAFEEQLKLPEEDSSKPITDHHSMMAVFNTCDTFSLRIRRSDVDESKRVLEFTWMDREPVLPPILYPHPMIAFSQIHEHPMDFKLEASIPIQSSEPVLKILPMESTTSAK